MWLTFCTHLSSPVGMPQVPPLYDAWSYYNKHGWLRVATNYAPPTILGYLSLPPTWVQIFFIADRSQTPSIVGINNRVHKAMGLRRRNKFLIGSIYFSFANVSVIRSSSGNMFKPWLYLNASLQCLLSQHLVYVIVMSTVTTSSICHCNVYCHNI
jgi:hypothetical protein